MRDGGLCFIDQPAKTMHTPIDLNYQFFYNHFFQLFFQCRGFFRALLQFSRWLGRNHFFVILFDQSVLGGREGGLREKKNNSSVINVQWSLKLAINLTKLDATIWLSFHLNCCDGGLPVSVPCSFFSLFVCQNCNCLFKVCLLFGKQEFF